METQEGLGEIYYLRKDYPKALKHFSRYALLSPDDWYAQNRLGWTLIFSAELHPE